MGTIVTDSNMEDVPQNAAEHCPGTQSEDAGKSSSCAGCPNQQICSSGVTKLPDPAIEDIKENLSNVKHKILILSGKGGVGKSTMTSMLARALALDPEKNVGVMDVDICGPSGPRIMGVEGEQVHQSGSGWSPVFVDDNLSVMSVGFLLPSLDDAVIWKGNKKTDLIKKFLREVDWGSLDYLIVDTPPGTSDEHLSLVQYMAPCKIDGAVIVTTPQEISLLDVRKEINFCKKVNIPIIGVVENMSWFVCPKCTGESQIFPSTTEGAQKMAEEMQINFLGKIPLDQSVARCCDEGKNFFEIHPDSLPSLAYKEIVRAILDKLEDSSS